ncbi:MAG: trypsin-like serine protease, partial [Anaerolineaceae bacterium]|nr:trypsin-like serine protease [Anaerolineaceae bacterium]
MSGRSWAVRILACLLLITLLLPTQPVNAQQPVPSSTLESEGMLVFKNFEDPTPVTHPHPAPCSGADCDFGATAYYKPFTPFITSTSNPSPVDNPSLWPYAATVKIISHWPSGETSTCSGTLVDAKYVLTAAHCIYTFIPENCYPGDSACWVDDLEALPAYQDGEAPAGRSGYETILTWTDWTDNQLAEYDLAAIKLRYPLGAQVGWLGAGFYADNAFFTNNTFAIAGYPESAPYNGADMAFWSGQVSVVTASDDLLEFNGNFDPGWEGATLNAENGVAYGVVSSVSGGTDVTLTRITYAKFDAIRTFIQDGQPKEDGGNLTSFTVQAKPEWNFPGQALTGMDFILWNYSNSALPHATYLVEIYLSTDNLITTAD